MSSIQVLYDLCQYPEYFEALRMEAETHSGSDEKLELSAEKPLLDSFIKESNRVTPGEAISIRRKVIAPVTLPGGVSLQQGDAIIVAQQNIMQDESNFHNAQSFKGFRFAPGDPECTESSRFADIDPSYLLWGAGKHGW
ncbi:MAG: hypothetical protein LQ340_003816 [Diploschistes diacapsis]|nr:MAG: hypothetical protein LQ340_003816 [Diploschistes diacapsis]